MTYTVYLPFVAKGEGMTTRGIDISIWQDNNSTAQKMDFAKAYAAGARFVFIKTSQALYQDEDILYNWKSARAAGLLRGGYHFLDWAADPVAQARFAWSLIQADPGELPPVCDFESWGIVPANAEDRLWAYLQEMEHLSGRVPIIYTGAFFWSAQANQDAKWEKYPLWMASYSTQQYMENNVTALTPWNNWTFWQYTSKGDGLAYGAESLNIDLDYFNGSYEDLLKFANVTPPAPPTPPEPMVDLQNIYNELVDLRTRYDNDYAARLARVEALLTDIPPMQSGDAEAYAAFTRELDYIKTLVKPGG